MQLSVTFRHMPSTEPLKEYAREKVDRIHKYFSDPIKAHVVLDAERPHELTADVAITLKNGFQIKGRETTEDMYSSVDLVIAKIERQVRRYKEKLRHHKGLESLHESQEITHSVFSVPTQNSNDVAGPSTIIKATKIQALPMTPEEAVMQMHLLENQFFVFTHATTRALCVVYRRENNTYGLIET